MSIMDNFSYNSQSGYCCPPPPPPHHCCPPPKHHVSLGNSITLGQDYNLLINQPIINLVGLSNPVIFADLEAGIYSIKGNYKYSYDDVTSHTFAQNQQVEVVYDVAFGKKIIHYLYFQGENTYLKKITYEVDNTYNIENIGLESSTTILEALPEAGIPGEIYSTTEGAFVWIDGEYKQLGVSIPKWNEF